MPHTSKIIGKANLSLKDFKSSLVNQKQFYSLVTFDKFIGYLKCAICWDAGQELVDVKALNLRMHDQISGLYMPPVEYCACDGLPDEWMDLIPNIKDTNSKMQSKILEFLSKQSPEKPLSKT